MFTTRKACFSHVIGMMIFIFVLLLITPVFAGITNNSAISVAVSPSTITPGDSLLISGTTSGNPISGVTIWIFCKNYANIVTVQPDSTGEFNYQFDSGSMAAYDIATYHSSANHIGVCYIVAQHPMQNNQFDIYLKSSTVGAVGYGEVYNRLLDAPVKIDDTNIFDTNIFKVFGAGSIVGGDAEWYLTESLKDSSVDDNYAESQFSFVAPTTASPTHTVTTTLTTIPTPTSTTAIPIISSISPVSGSTLGGTAVTITGTGFNKVGVSWVKFGNTQVGITGVYNQGDSTDLVTAISPAGSAGTVDITVITDSGTTATSAATKFTYTAPTTTTAVETFSTTLATTSPITTITPVSSTPTLLPTIVTTSSTTTASPTSNIEKLLEEQNKKIDEQNKLISEQNKKIAEQNDVLTQLINYLKGIFGWT
jgi:hypothetical protein